MDVKLYSYSLYNIEKEVNGLLQASIVDPSCLTNVKVSRNGWTGEHMRGLLLPFGRQDSCQRRHILDSVQGCRREVRDGRIWLDLHICSVCASSSGGSLVTIGARVRLEGRDAVVLVSLADS